MKMDTLTEPLRKVGYPLKEVGYSLKELGYYALHLIPGVGIGLAYKSAKEASKLAKAIMLGQIPYKIDNEDRLDDENKIDNEEKINSTIALGNSKRIILYTEGMRIGTIMLWRLLRSLPQPFNYIGDAVGISTIILPPIGQIIFSYKARKFVSEYRED